MRRRAFLYATQADEPKLRRIVQAQMEAWAVEEDRKLVALQPLALERLASMEFVGLTSRWTDSVCLWHAMHGTAPTAAELLKPDELFDVDAEQLLHSGGTGDLVKRDPSLLDPAWRDPVDEALWEAAQARFARDMALYTSCPA